MAAHLNQTHLIDGDMLSQHTQPKDSDSATPEPSEGGAATRHRRGYQACDPCRERKVKCDTGNVDNPEDGPCARCRRERIKCVFAPTRKRPKGAEPVEPPAQRPATNKRRRTDSQDGSNIDPSIQSGRHSVTSVPYSTVTYPTQEWQKSTNYSLTSPTGGSRSSLAASTKVNADLRHVRTNGTLARKRTGADDNVQVHSKMARHTLGAAIASTQDNIMLLVEAATNAMPEEPNSNYDSPHSERAARAKAISTAIAGGPSEVNEVGLTPQEHVEKEQALKAWSRMRFVRAGWFTAKEALQYVEYFYDRMAPMTPVVTPDYRSHTRQLALLTDEPILALTILAIASRHKPLTGHAAMSRGYQIHDKLWTYLRYTIERLLWGQEQFGGGFCGGGSADIRELPSGQLTWKGSLRTLGTIEALLLLTDWLPRALHFPMSDSEQRLIAPDPHKDSGPELGYDADSTTSDGNHNKPYASWLEPNWRSDRMSWMLLGIAQALSFELGVFEDEHTNKHHSNKTDPDYKRKQRLRRLVIIHVSQTSGRIGIPSALSTADWSAEFFDRAALTAPLSPNEDPIDVMQNCWFHIASIMNRANRTMFGSREMTRELISGGEYKQVIAKISEMLQEWRQKFDHLSHHMKPMMRNILRMEYEYARLFVNSLGLQHVVESWLGHGPNLSTSAMVKSLEANKVFIDEVSDAALTILSTVVHGLASKGYLRDAPVRTYHRSLSGMMFTLKRLSLGNHEETVRHSLNLLTQVTDAMAKEVVDDVHLSASTARLVQNLSKYVKDSLIRVQKPAGSGFQSRSNSRGATPQPGQTDTQLPQPTNLQQSHQSINHSLAGTNPPNFSAFDHRFYGVDPLAEIQARPLADFSTQTFVPPPNFNAALDLDQSLTNGPHNSNAATTTSTGADDSNAAVGTGLDNSVFDTDWFALPLDNLWDDSAATVDQGFGGTGPTVGSRDMLEVITNRDYNELHWNGTNQGLGGFTGM